MLKTAKNMIITEKVADRVRYSVELLNEKPGQLIQRMANTMNAYELAEKAATDETLVGLLYFPEDQKFGIYVPLFLPAGMSLLGSAKVLFNYFKADKLKSE